MNITKNKNNHFDASSLLSQEQQHHNQQQRRKQQRQLQQQQQQQQQQQHQLFLEQKKRQLEEKLRHHEHQIKEQQHKQYLLQLQVSQQGHLSGAALAASRHGYIPRTGEAESEAENNSVRRNTYNNWSQHLSVDGEGESEGRGGIGIVLRDPHDTQFAHLSLSDSPLAQASIHSLNGPTSSAPSPVPFPSFLYNKDKDKERRKPVSSSGENNNNNSVFRSQGIILSESATIAKTLQEMKQARDDSLRKLDAMRSTSRGSATAPTANTSTVPTTTAVFNLRSSSSSGEEDDIDDAFIVPVQDASTSLHGRRGGTRVRGKGGGGVGGYNSHLMLSDDDTRSSSGEEWDEETNLRRELSFF